MFMFFSGKALAGIVKQEAVDSAETNASVVSRVASSGSLAPTQPEMTMSPRKKPRKQQW